MKQSVLISILLSAVILGCTSSEVPSGPQSEGSADPTSSSNPDSPAPSGWLTVSDDTEPVYITEDSTESVAGVEDGPSLGDDASAASGEGASDTPEPGNELQDSFAIAVDPCSLLSTTAWSAILGVPSATSVRLEDGEACGFIEAADATRLALGVFQGTTPAEWGIDEAAAETVAVPGATHAYWAAELPDAQSGILVVMFGDGPLSGELVLEIGHRGGEHSFDALRDLAVQAATEALRAHTDGGAS